jgi:ribonuclease P protein component
MAYPPHHVLAEPETLLLPLNRPESFSASLRGPSVHAEEFRLHFRDAREPDVANEVLQSCGPAGRICVLGFVLPKRLCKHAVRRNLIRRATRDGLREHLRTVPDWPSAPPPVLVLKLTRKLPETFVSASSPALSRYVKARIQALLNLYARRGRLSATSARPGFADQGPSQIQAETRP